MFKSVFTGKYVYCEQQRYYSVLYYVESVQYVGIVEAIFTHYAQTSEHLVLIRCLDLVYPDAGN